MAKTSTTKAKISMTPRLIKWFRKNRRNLPWREDHDPYRVWISEIMLQQTQVITVIPYFKRWMTQFPSVQALAKAPLDKVLKSWEGLGYYRRARLLHKSADILNQKGFPETFEGWLELPGIGPYTAAAISSIVNHQKVVAVDGNVKRVVSRVFALVETSETIARQHLFPLMPSKCPGDFNEALMELGATMCTPKNPKCPECPIKMHCQAFIQNRVLEFPVTTPKLTIPQYQKYALVYLDKNHLWLRQRTHEEMLNGLWGFVLEDKKPRGTSLPIVKHAYTHFRLIVTPVLTLQPPNTGQLVSYKKIETLALSTLDHKILEVLREQGIL